MSRPRVIAVLRLLGRPGRGLHEICVLRLRRAEREAAAGDIVLLSGWARRGSAASEAELMGRGVERAVPRAGRRPVGALDVRERPRRCPASPRRRTRARSSSSPPPGMAGERPALLRAALRGPGTTIRLATTDEPPSVSTRLREIACWTMVPLGVAHP